MAEIQRFVAKVTRGAEEALAQELSAMGVDAWVHRNSVRFEGPVETGLRVCLWSRLASRVLLVLYDFPARTAGQLYRGVNRVPWGEHVDPDGTIAVDFAGANKNIRDTRFGAVKAKDAIVDRMRKDFDRRPSVSRERPDLRINVHLLAERATVAVDLSGEPLHLRGRGRDTGVAPLRENLAAAMLWLAGWPQALREGQPMLDPMCGSGTLLSEAAGWAADQAPGLFREHWGFTGWKGHRPEVWARLLDEARQRVRPEPENAFIFGRDIDGGVLRSARANLARYELEDWVKIQRQEVADLRTPAGPGVMVTNPPYGERLGVNDDLLALYSTLGQVMRERLGGWSCWLITSEKALADQIGLRARRRIPLYNGALDCRLLYYPVYERKKKE